MCEGCWDCSLWALNIVRSAASARCQNILVNAATSDILMRRHKKRQGCRKCPIYKYVWFERVCETAAETWWTLHCLCCVSSEWDWGAAWWKDGRAGAACFGMRSNLYVASALLATRPSINFQATSAKESESKQALRSSVLPTHHNRSLEGIEGVGYFRRWRSVLRWI